jgi:hypothetical protein
MCICWCLILYNKIHALIFPTHLVEKFVILRIIQGDIIIKVHRSSYQVSIILVRF